MNSLLTSFIEAKDEIEKMFLEELPPLINYYVEDTIILECKVTNNDADVSWFYNGKVLTFDNETK